MSDAQTKEARSHAGKLFDFFASFGFAAVLLLFLFLLTYLGTVEQVKYGLFEVQQKYFNSFFFLVHWAFDAIPIPLPGVGLLLSLLTINLVLGGLVRIRKSRYTVGVIVAHVGIIIMLLAGLITFLFNEEGALSLREGQTSGEFASYYDWELAISRADQSGKVEELLIPESDLAGVTPETPRSFHSEKLPFQLKVSRYFGNCDVKPEPGHDGPTIDGFALISKPPRLEAEADVRGLYAWIESEGSSQEVILHGASIQPLVFTADGRRWALELRHKRLDLPFKVHLREAIQEKHPGTEMAKAFASEVTKIEGDHRQDLKIEMNAPLRHGGYTLFQSQYQLERSGRARSVLAVVKTPASWWDWWPIFSCTVIVVGLFIHFALKLLLYIRAQQTKRAAT